MKHEFQHVPKRRQKKKTEMPVSVHAIRVKLNFIIIDQDVKSNCAKKTNLKSILMIVFAFGCLTRSPSNVHRLTIKRVDKIFFSFALWVCVCLCWEIDGKHSHYYSSHLNCWISYFRKSSEIDKRWVKPVNIPSRWWDFHSLSGLRIGKFAFFLFFCQSEWKKNVFKNLINMMECLLVNIHLK